MSGGRGPVLEAVGALRLVADPLAVVELDAALAHLVDDAVVVGGHHHGGAGAVDPVEQLHDAHRGGGVEVAGRLVGDQDHRPVDEGPGHRDALLLAARELVGQPVGLGVEAHLLEGLGHQGTDLLGRVPGDLHRERDVLGHGLRLQQPEVLEDGADLAPQPGHLPAGEPVDLLAGDVDAARRGPGLAQDQAQGRGLAGAGAADQEDELALLDVDRHVVEGGASGAGVGLGDLLEANHPHEITPGGQECPPRRRRPRP